MKMSSSVLLMVLVVLSSSVLFISVTALDFESREMKSGDTNKRPFFTNRYGRSFDIGGAGDSFKQSVRVVPRNDRFFLGSRYGKRNILSAAKKTQNDLNCIYTGTSNLYRCFDYPEVSTSSETNERK